MDQKNATRSLAKVIGTAVVVSLLMLSFVRYGLDSLGPGGGGLQPGNPAPPIAAVGWVNGDAPTAESLAGKVVVVDAWATWCGPCRRKAPDLVRSYEKFRDRGVVFIGLTDEGPDSLEKIEAFLGETGITWVNGYGATDTLTRLEAYAIPAMWVIDASGTITWNHGSRGSLDDAIEKALAAQG